MTGDEQPAENDAVRLAKLTADNMVLQVVLRSLLFALARTEPDGGVGLVADLTGGIERLTTAGVMVNTSESGRALVRNHALRFAAGLLDDAARN